LLVRRAKTGKVHALVAPSGPPLGPFDGAAYSQRRAHLGIGDVTLMYTDGLIERRDGNIADGIVRVSDCLAAWPGGRPLDELCEQLVGALAVQPQLDDICVLAVGRAAT
jgi:serine phosphatase RsbU (regulator of sigma subunit)